MNYFETLNKINVSDKTEKKNGLTYLSWAWAWGEVKKLYPESIYTVYENKDEWNYFTDGITGWVKTGVTIDFGNGSSIEHIEYLPIMDFKNKSIVAANITSFDVNKAIQRSLTKAIARHGLGLYIYAGEDLPEDTQSDVPEKEKVDTNQKISKIYVDSITETLKDTDSDVASFLTYMDVEKIEDITMGDFMKKAKPALDAKLKGKKK